MSKLFYVNTFLNIPDKKVNNLSLLQSNFEEYFVQIKNTHMILDLEDSLDFNYLNGAIILKYFEQTLLDTTLWDLVDQLWAYILNVLGDMLITGYGETYFPDQPIKLCLKSISKHIILYEIESNKNLKVILPKNELIETLLDGADEFFKGMEAYFKEKCNYQYEINKIASLRTLF